MTNSDQSLLVAQLKSAYGIKGWLWIYSYTDPIDALFGYQPLFYFDNNKKKKELLIEQWRKQGKGLIVKLSDIDDRTEAEKLSSTEIWVDKEHLPLLEDGEFYWSDLVGLQVVNKQGELLGTVKELFETPAHQVLQIEATADSVDDESRLIPYHETTIVNVDLDTGVISVVWDKDF